MSMLVEGLNLVALGEPSVAAWTLDGLFKGTAKYAKTAGGALITLLGVLLIIFAAFKMFKAVTGQQQGGGEWLKAIVALLLGGALSVGGWKLLNTMASGGKQTIEKLGQGSIVQDTLTPYAELGRTFLQMFY